MDAAPPPPAAVHACAPDAIKRGRTLLNLHFNDGQPGDPPLVDIDNGVKALPSVKALKGKGRFDVLEVWGYIYKAEYRMRFLYAQMPGTCVLMGQEILEASDPY
jgi:hypothetical protein